MQHSKSLGSFASSSVDNGSGNLLAPNRPRSRSSLDTFLIPGRTRLPSQKTEAFDEAVAQHLLKEKMAQRRNPPPYTETSRHSSNEQRLRLIPSEESAFNEHHGYHVGDSLYRIMRQPALRISNCDNITVPHHQHHLGRLGPKTSPSPKSPSPSSTYQPTYDGALDPGPESRVTSTTWSSVSRVSHRISSDASNDTRDVLRFHDLYDELAVGHGLPKLAFPPNEAVERPSIKSSTKEHKYGWFSRKFLTKASTTYTYKARTTYRPIARKKSFSRVPSITDGLRRNILEGKTLEETCRLGGLGVLVLPKEYAIDKLTIPTCLSATATYLLQHGVNAPGLFRVSGQTVIVNALYDYYSHQFNNAGSPSKVQTTVQSGQLPLHIEYALPDVASFFKKILNGLPGGLLGSTELFEAIHAVFKSEPASDFSHHNVKSLRAKLIALAILSVPSLHRFHLIQAVLGLAAYLGNEAELARVAFQPTREKELDRKPSSELMGFQALGVCLGPLLMGDLTDKIGSPDGMPEDTPRTSTESNQKTKKKRLSIVPNKLERDADLNAHVERANLTANTMQNLLTIWQEVVNQLSIVTTPNKTALKVNSTNQLRDMSRRLSNAHSVKVSDEELLFLDMMRGGRLPQDQPLDLVIKRKVKAKNKSSISRLNLKPSEQSPQGIKRPEEPNQPDAARDLQTPRQEKRKAMIDFQTRTPSDTMPSDDNRPPGQTSSSSLEHLNGVPGLDKMSMGQILPARDSSRHPSSKSSHLRRHTTMRTPRQSDSRRSSVAATETALKDLSSSDRNMIRDYDSQVQSLDKPLPALKRESSGVLMSDLSLQEQTYPPRQSSLASDDNSSTKSHITPKPTSGNNGSNRARTGSHSTELASIDQFHGKSTDGRQNQDDLDNAEPSQADDANRISDRHGVGDPSLTGRNLELGSAQSIVNRSEHELPLIHAFIKPLTSPPSSLDDPFSSLRNQGSPKSSLIPKPVNGLGHGRLASSRSISPPKSLRSPKKSPIASNIFEDDPIAMQNHGLVTSQAPDLEIGKDESVGRDKKTASTRPLSAYTFESLQRLKLALEEPQTALHIPTRILPPERNCTHSTSPSRSNCNPSSSESPETTVKRSGSANATLYAEITRLKRQLEQRTEEVLATRRSLDAARDTREQVSGNSTPKRGSWNKGTLSAEIREMRRDRDVWKKRAEWAEKRLEGLGSLAHIVADGRHGESFEESAWDNSDSEAEACTNNRRVTQRKAPSKASVEDHKNSHRSEDSAQVIVDLRTAF